jgi:hypothetical protein
MKYVPSFETEDELARHRVIVHGDFCCPRCEWRFETPSGRVRHLKKDHRLSAREVAGIVPFRRGVY